MSKRDQVEVAKAIPLKAIPFDLTSTAKSIRNRRQVEFRPVENTEFKFSGNSQMSFAVSSSSEYMDGQDHYFQFKLTTNSNNNYTKKSLNIGGGHNVVRCLEIRLQNGQLIERIDRYNRLYALKSLATHSRDHVEWFEQAAGDSVSGTMAMDEGCGGEFLPGTVSVPINSNNVTGVGTNFVASVIPGDIVEFYTAAGVRITTAIVGPAITDTTLVLDKDVVAAIPAESKIKVISKMPQRAVAANDETHTITIKLNSEFLMHKNLIPLKYLRQGLLIKIDLERPEFIMQSNRDYLVTNPETLPAFDYTITDPILFATMVTLSEDVDKMMMDKFNDKGITYEFLSYQHRLNVDQSGGSGPAKFSNNVGRRSVRHVYTVIQPVWCESVSRESYNFDNTATFLKTGLTSYQYKVGAEEYPYREVATNDALNARVFTELAITNGHHGGTLFDCRFCPSEWRTENYFDGITDGPAGVPFAESKHLILSTRLDRDSSPWTGANTSVNPLEIELEFGSGHFVKVAGAASVAKSRYIHSWVAFDNAINISKDGVILYN